MAGSYILPSLQIKYKDDKGVEQTAKTSEIFIEVQSENTSAPTQGEEKDIRDIKPIIPAPLPPWIWILSTLVLFSILGYFLFRYLSKRKKSLQIPPKLSHELALERLDSLKNSGLLSKNLFKKFHFDLSEIARFYLEGRFQIPASDRTTEELQAEFKSFIVLDEKLKTQFLDLIKKMDLIKFTDTFISTEDSLQILEQTRGFVLVTKPVEMPISTTTTKKPEEDRFL
jgi:hypothetical protein